MAERHDMLPPAERPSMSDQLPKGAATPQCNKCQTPMGFAMTIWLISEPGHLDVFECGRCGKLNFRTNHTSR
jgi:hypothetical protein